MSELTADDPLTSFRLDDRLIVVTGASEGIGRAFAESFARAGARIVLVSRRPEKLEEVRRTIADRGGNAEVVTADVRDVATIRALAETVQRLMQRDDRKLVLVNNAGFGFTKPIAEVTAQDWETMFDTHVKGAFFCSQQIGALMIKRGYGKIINMSSTWSVATQSGKSVYCAAKAAVSHLTAALSTEWAPPRRPGQCAGAGLHEHRFGEREDGERPGTLRTDAEPRQARPFREAIRPRRRRDLSCQRRVRLRHRPDTVRGRRLYDLTLIREPQGKTVVPRGRFTSSDSQSSM